MRADRSRWLVLACVLLMAASVIGCKSAEDKAAEELAGKAIGADVDVDGEKVTVTDGDSSITAGGDQELPAGFPVTVPVYRDADITGSVTGEKDGAKTYTVTYLSDAEPTAVFEWYMGEVEAKGWNVLMTAAPQFGGVVSAENDYNLINVAISETSEKGAKTNVVLFAGPPANH